MIGLTQKALAGVLFQFVIFCLALFIPARTFNFWQAWVFLACWCGPVLFVTLYFLKYDPGLIRRRLKTGPIAERRIRQKVIQSFAALSFLILFILPGLDHRFQWSDVPAVLVVAADIFVVCGLTIVFRVFRENSFTSAIIDVETDQVLISTGPYSVVRHPMYAGALLAIFCTPIALGSWWGLLCACPMFVMIVLRLLDEEVLLLRSLPGYREYCERVPWRLLPRIW